MKNVEDGIFKIYMSHWIRGPKGVNATVEDIKENIKNNIIIGTIIKSYLIDWEKMDGLPKCHLYVPAEHDEFVQIAFEKHYVSEQEILDVDCSIIDSCDLLLVYGDYMSSRGMKVEIEHALSVGIPVYYMSTIDASNLHGLKTSILLVEKIGENADLDEDIEMEDDNEMDE